MHLHVGALLEERIQGPSLSPKIILHVALVQHHLQGGTRQSQLAENTVTIDI